jgi:recombination DNA repair RAD52 pathway protein
MSHLAAYDVRAHLNRVFGFARWEGEVVESWQLFEEVDGEKKWNPEKRGRNGSTYAGWDDNRKVSVGYRVRYRLVVKAPDGTELARYTEEGTGDANNFPGTKRADAHDFAVKTAESQAMKRCAINLGDQFGLSLYRNGSTEPVVTVTLVGQLENPEEGTATAVDDQAPAVVAEQEPETPAAGEDEVSPPAAAQALADLSGRLTDADSLRDLYRQAAEAHLLPELVTYGADGQVRPLAYVITSAAERVTKQAEGGEAA